MAGGNIGKVIHLFIHGYFTREGHESIGGLRDAYRGKIDEMKQGESAKLTSEAEAHAKALGQHDLQSKPVDPNLRKIGSAAASSSSDPSKSPVKPLSSYLDLEKIRTLDAPQIEALWRLRHAHNPHSLCACLPVDTYLRMAENAKKYPRFVLPLPREMEIPLQPSPQSGGSDNQSASASSQPVTTKETAAEMHFLQWCFHPPALPSTPEPAPAPTKPSLNTHTSTVLITQLAAFKLHVSFASPHTVLTHHLDLADDKGLVLMHGSVVPNAGINTEEARLLSLWVRSFYDWSSTATAKKGELVQKFNEGDVQGFKIEEILEEVQRL